MLNLPFIFLNKISCNDLLPFTLGLSICHKQIYQKKKYVYTFFVEDDSVKNYIILHSEDNDFPMAVTVTSLY
jgi:hypothetical protein